METKNCKMCRWTGKAGWLQAAESAISTGAVRSKAASPAITSAQYDPLCNKIDSVCCVSVFPTDTIDLLRQGTWPSYCWEPCKQKGFSVEDRQ